jgi:hypothetical protein
MKLTRPSMIFVAVLLLAAGCYLSDPLNRFELGENYLRLTNPLWPNRFSTIVEKPPTDSLEDVLYEYSDDNRVKGFKILEIKRVWLIGNSAPTVGARVEADS